MISFPHKSQYIFHTLKLRTSMSMSISMSMRVKASSTIKPAEPTPKHRIWVSDIDLIQPVTHAPTVYFYKPNTPNTTTFFSSYIIKNALSKTLVHFYPLAGRLRYDESRRLEIDCNEAGIIFYEAESDVEINDFGYFKPTPELRNLAPHIDYTTDITEWPLVLVQLTVFRCGGVSLGLAASHTVVDGPSASHFVSTWAKIACTGTSNVCLPPFMNRTLLRARDPPVEPAFEHEEFKPPPRLLDQEGGGRPEEERKVETMVEMFKFNAQQVNAIREAANMGQNGSSGPQFSRFESVAAHMWRSTSKARGLDGDQMTELQIPVQGRTRLQPPLPKGFFGNVVFRGIMVARSGDLVTSPVGYAAGRIRERLEKMNDKYLRSVLDFLNGQEDLTPLRSGSHTLGCTQRGRFYGCPNLVLTSWLGIPFYDADFGWGPPMYMGPAALGFEGKGFIFPTKEADGGMTVALRLQCKHMENLKELLSNHAL